MKPISINNNTFNNIQFIIDDIHLGKTTIEDAEKLGYTSEKSENSCSISAKRDKFCFFWDCNCNGILESFNITSFEEFPQSLKDMGFDFLLSYNEWIELLRQQGYTIENKTLPHQEYFKHKGYECFSAEVVATKSNVKGINLNFNYEQGNEDSGNTLFEITIKIYD